MSRNGRYKQAQEKRESGGFTPLPHVVLRSQNFSHLSNRAIKLLMDLLAQYKGDNNGDLCAAWTLMKKRNWRSEATLDKAKKELVAKGWIEITRQGGRHKASLYAITFMAIDYCKGKLDVNDTHSPKSTWRNHEPAPPLPIHKNLLRLP